MIWAYTMTPSSWCIKHPVWFWHASMRSPYHPWTRLDLDPEMDFDDSIYSVEFHASKILLLITGTWKSSWKFYTVPKIHNQSSGTGGSRYSCWRVPVNCTGSTAIMICWIRWTLLIVWFPTRRREFASPRLYVGPALFLDFFTLPPLPWLYTAVCCSGDCALPI